MIWETGPERGLNLASFGSPWFMQTENIQTGQVNAFLSGFFSLNSSLKRLNNAGGLIVWTNVSKNNSVAVKLKIKICPLHEDKRAKQTCSDVLDVLLTADNNGWNLQASHSRKKEEVKNIPRLPVGTVSVLHAYTPEWD